MHVRVDGVRVGRATPGATSRPTVGVDGSASPANATASGTGRTGPSLVIRFGVDSRAGRI